ncbi:agmatinase family protein [Haliangium sp.]|uniref:agmatinase family protein n=1 Tax=Haliangium sp. TaxID=2663208 RepID=UPI003D139536
MSDYLDMLEGLSLDTFAGTPRPGWSGPDTLFGAPLAPLGATGDARYIVAGVPFDGTASSRPGAAEGPRAIRRASLVFSSYLDSLGEHEMHDTRTGEVFRYARSSVVDCGDLHVFPSDPLRTFQAVATEVRAMVRGGASTTMPILLGGDHSIGFATFAGVMSALRERGTDQRLGLIQIDHHFDFGAHSAIHGPIYHGSNARRISELPGMERRQMAFLGAANVTRKAQFDGLIADGAHIVTAREFRRRGVTEALAPVIDTMAKSCSAIYLSIDIDCLDASVAPGTGHVSIGGLTAGELMDIVAGLLVLPIAGMEIVEVAPRYDPTGRTAQIAAQVLFEALFRATL